MRIHHSLVLLIAAALILSSCDAKKKEEKPQGENTVQSIPEMPPLSVDTSSFANAGFNQAAPAVAGSAGAAPTVNPPHGQPYHRCDIAVGAPLNSAPAPKPQTATPQTQTPPPPVQVTQPAPQVQSAPTGKAPEKNPAHGQPFHRCDIPVGAPLDSIPPKK
jgi:hypothetical protein